MLNRKYANLMTTGPASIHGEVKSEQVESLESEKIKVKVKKNEQGQGQEKQKKIKKKEEPYKDPIPKEIKEEKEAVEDERALEWGEPKESAIEPEEEDRGPDLTPEMIEKLTLLGKEIMKQWDLEVIDLEVIQGAQMALVWKVTTPDGPVCLKRINRPEKKALFSVYAQNDLAEKGARVPSILITKEKQLYAKHGPFLFVVYEWIEGRQFDLTVPDDVAWMMKGLAEYHLNSVGYRPPEGVPETSKLGQWPKHYTKRCKQMESWMLIAEKQPEDPFSKFYLETIDEFITSGWNTLNELENSYYNEWVEESKREPMLCHQDYGTGNTMLLNDEVWVIDLDTTAYDLPIRDLRKIIIPLMSDSLAWQDEMFDHMLSSYEQVNPLSVEQKKVMYIDMMFPYELYDVARDKFSLQGEVDPLALEEAETFERLKNEKINHYLEQL